MLNVYNVSHILLGVEDPKDSFKYLQVLSRQTRDQDLHTRMILCSRVYAGILEVLKRDVELPEEGAGGTFPLVPIWLSLNWVRAPPQ